MDFQELTKKRITTYEFSKKPVKISDLKYILECGRWAPSSLNTQPWFFHIVKNKDAISKLLKTSFYGAFHTDPPLLVVVTINEKETHAHDYQQTKEYRSGLASMSVAMASENILLAATSKKIDSCLLSPQKDISKIIKLDKSEKVAFMIGLGYATKKLSGVRKRKSLKEIVKYHD